MLFGQAALLQSRHAKCAEQATIADKIVALHRETLSSPCAAAAALLSRRHAAARAAARLGGLLWSAPSHCIEPLGCRHHCCYTSCAHMHARSTKLEHASFQNSQVAVVVECIETAISQKLRVVTLEVGAVVARDTEGWVVPLGISNAMEVLVQIRLCSLQRQMTQGGVAGCPAEQHMEHSCPAGSSLRKHTAPTNCSWVAACSASRPLVRSPCGPVR